MPRPQKSRIILHRRADDSLILQWNNPLSTPTGRELLTDLHPGHNVVNVGVIDYDERGTPTFTPKRSDYAFAALTSPKIQARIASALQSFWQYGCDWLR